MKMKKILFSVVLIIVAMAFTTNLYATPIPLPWLEFGNNFIWDSNSNMLTGDSTLVDGIRYTDNSSIPPPVFPSPDPALWSDVIISLSFDGNNTNDTLTITDGVTTWLSANLDIIGSPIDPLTPGTITVKVELSGLNIATNMGSQWADEFASRIYSTTYPANMLIGWFGYSDLGGGVYRLNGGGKIAPVPEPGTLILLGSGLIGVAFYARRRKVS
jgi:hypothetical protein